MQAIKPMTQEQIKNHKSKDEPLYLVDRDLKIIKVWNQNHYNVRKDTSITDLLLRCPSYENYWHALGHKIRLEQANQELDKIFQLIKSIWPDGRWNEPLLILVHPQLYLKLELILKHIGSLWESCDVTSQHGASGYSQHGASGYPEPNFYLMGNVVMPL